MQNRAKCKLCDCIIESFHSTDYVVCKCGEIYVEGGESMRCGAKDWSNFLRVDDKGNEIIVKVKEVDLKPEETSKPNRKELLDLLDGMVKNIENLPKKAMISAVTHYDFCSLMILLSSIFRSEE